MNYQVTYDSNVANAAATGALAGMAVFTLIISIAVAVFEIIVMWKLFTKAGKPGWAAIVPFYNLYVLFEITWGNGWLFLLTFLAIIPIVGSIAVLVIMIITMVKLAKAFGKSGGFAVGLVFLTLIFEAILAFGDSKYVGVDGVSAQQPEAAPQPSTINPVQPETTPVVEQPTMQQPVDSSSTEASQSNENSNL